MIVHDNPDFVRAVQAFDVDSEYVVVKPNWISNTRGEYTEPEIIDWLLEAFPSQKKIIIESFTPWRGQTYAQSPLERQLEDDQLAVSLTDGIDYWDFYKQADEQFLRETGIREILDKHGAEYINITNEVWSGRCVDSEIIADLVGAEPAKLRWPELLEYFPEKLFALRDRATLVSLAKIKQEPTIPEVRVNLSIKNLFGLVPHPSRWVPFHDENHAHIPRAIAEIAHIYVSVFASNLWINEGIRTSVRNYCDDAQTVDTDQGLLFVGRSALDVDGETCRALGLVPEDLIQLQTVKDILGPQ